MAIGIFETLAIGKRRVPFTDTRAPDSMWMAAIPMSPPTRRATRSSEAPNESETAHSVHAVRATECPLATG